MLLAASGTSFEPCPPHAHHKNGVAERMIGVIAEKARAMMIDSQAPLEFWGEAVGTAVYLHCLTPNEGLTKRDDRDGYKAAYETPYEMLHAYGKPPINANGNKISYKAPLHHLRRFDCFVLIQLFIPRYMRPGGAWQRLCRCPLRGNGGLL